MDAVEVTGLKMKVYLLSKSNIVNMYSPKCTDFATTVCYQFSPVPFPLFLISYYSISSATSSTCHDNPWRRWWSSQFFFHGSLGPVDCLIMGHFHLHSSFFAPCLGRVLVVLGKEITSVLSSVLLSGLSDLHSLSWITSLRSKVSESAFLPKVK